MKKTLFIATAAFILTSCNDNSASTSSGTSTDSTSNSQETKEERNKETALAGAKSFNDNTNVDDVLKDADKDVVDYMTGEMPPAKGIDSTKAELKRFLAAFPDYKGSDLMAVADGDYVMVHGIWSGTWKNDFMGMKATGKSFKMPDVDIFKFNDAGKIIEHRSVQSINELARQTGMQMPSEHKP